MISSRRTLSCQHYTRKKDLWLSFLVSFALKIFPISLCILHLRMGKHSIHYHIPNPQSVLIEDTMKHGFVLLAVPNANDVLYDYQYSQHISQYWDSIIYFFWVIMINWAHRSLSSDIGDVVQYCPSSYPSTDQSVILTTTGTDGWGWRDGFCNNLKTFLGLQYLVCYIYKQMRPTVCVCCSL